MMNDDPSAGLNENLDTARADIRRLRDRRFLVWILAEAPIDFDTASASELADATRLSVSWCAVILHLLNRQEDEFWFSADARGLDAPQDQTIRQRLQRALDLA